MAVFQFKGKEIHYRLVGEGPPVLLVHGFAEDGNLWHGQVEELSKNNLLIIPDLPGSGSSEMPEDVRSIADYAEVLKELTDQIPEKNFDQFCMIGHSMGGYITLAFAEKYPHLLSSFGLFHSSAYADSEEKIAAREKGIEFIAKNGTHPFLRTSVPNLFCDETKTNKPELVDALIETGNSISPEALIKYYQAMIQRPDRTSVLKSFDKPVLLIAGKFDAAVPLETSLQQFSMPSIAVVHILEHSGHIGMWEEAERSNSLLTNFLAEIR